MSKQAQDLISWASVVEHAAWLANSVEQETIALGRDESLLKGSEKKLEPFLARQTEHQDIASLAIVMKEAADQAERVEDYSRRHSLSKRRLKGREEDLGKYITSLPEPTRSEIYALTKQSRTLLEAL